MNSDKYIHSELEDKIYSYWEKNQLFKPKKNTKNFQLLYHRLMLLEVYTWGMH